MHGCKTMYLRLVIGRHDCSSKFLIWCWRNYVTRYDWHLRLTCNWSGSIGQFFGSNLSCADSASEWQSLCKSAALVSGVVWLHFWIVCGSDAYTDTWLWAAYKISHLTSPLPYVLRPCPYQFPAPPLLPSSLYLLHFSSASHSFPFCHSFLYSSLLAFSISSSSVCHHLSPPFSLESWVREKMGKWRKEK